MRPLKTRRTSGFWATRSWRAFNLLGSASRKVPLLAGRLGERMSFRSAARRALVSAPGMGHMMMLLMDQSPIIHWHARWAGEVPYGWGKCPAG